MISEKGVALAAAFRIFLVFVSVLWASAAEFDLVERGYCDVPVYMEEGVAQSMRRSAVANGYAYVCRSNDGVLIFDVRDIRAPRMIRKVAVAGASGVESKDQLLFVGSSNGLVVFDLSDPDYPVEVGLSSIEGGVSDLTLAGNTLYVADRPGGLQIVDVTNARQPTLRGRLLVGPGLVKPAVVGSTVIAARWSIPGIHVIDVRDPLNPVRVGGYSTGRDVTSVAAIGSVAFAAERGGGFYLVALDISDPSAPGFLSEYQSQGLEYLTAVGNRIYAAKWIYGIEAFDASNPRALKVQGSYVPDGDWSTHTLTLNGGNAFVTTTDESLRDRLLIVDFENGANLERIGRKPEIPLEYAATEGSLLCTVTPGTPSTTLRIFRSDSSEALDEIGQCELNGFASSVEIREGIAYLCLGGPVSEGLIA